MFLFLLEFAFCDGLFDPSIRISIWGIVFAGMIVDLHVCKLLLKSELTSITFDSVDEY